ncbi:hypothetical protein AK812_SmicGene8324 [Symbiodinium microadriaticum]|uniref:Secreted protein n=1 Tax=Symbiodinium microadriaticum TaxID=2951 RepID=A0A1Q9EL62_SYMMI|nr:hypothetical protein AK812_SmicGene8324 [Symbiodinium microadriaticum]
MGSPKRCWLLATLAAVGRLCFVSWPWMQETARLHGAVARRGWADPNWNWGSPIGTAHNEAMALRARLASATQTCSARFL